MKGDDMPPAEAKLLALLSLAAYAMAAAMAFLARHGQRAPVGRVGVAMTAAALGLNIALLSVRLSGGHLPATSGFDTFTLLALLTGAAAVYLRALGAMRRVAGILLPVAAVWMVLGVALAGAAYRDFAHDVWAAAHVALAAAAAACFFAAAAGGWLYLRKYRQLRSKDPDIFASPLPSLERLDRFIRQVLPAAFVLLTATILAGLAGALQPEREGYFRNWVTHPKILTAGITWLLYAVALHTAHAKRFRGRVRAGLSVAGFVLLVGVLVASMLLPKT